MDERAANLLGATALNVAELMLTQVREAAGTGGSSSAALVILAEAPDLAVTDLGRRIGLSQPAAARMVDGLERRGLVTRRPRSGRTVAVRLTPGGRRTVTRLLEHRAGVLAELVADLDETETEALATLLSKILSAVHGQVEQGETPTERIGEFVCRLCDRTACRRGGAPCPVSQTQAARGSCANAPAVTDGTLPRGGQHGNDDDRSDR